MRIDRATLRCALHYVVQVAHFVIRWLAVEVEANGLLVIFVSTNTGAFQSHLRRPAADVFWCEWKVNRGARGVIHFNDPFRLRAV